MSAKEQIQELIDKFHRKMEKDPEVKKKVEHLQKIFNLDLGDEKYTMKLKDARIYEFTETLDPEADVTIITTPENFQALVEGTLRPMKAYVTKKITVKGKIDDLMFLKNLF